MGISKVTRNYQISLPRDVRAQLNIKIGDVMMIKNVRDTVIVKPIKKDIVTETFGLWGKSKEPGWKTVKKMRKDWEKRRKRLGL